MTYSEKVAAWAADLRIDAIPADVIADQKNRVLDIIGTTLAASKMPSSQPLRDGALKLGGGNESRLLGYGDRTAAATAALANGAMAHALDYDDTHNESVVHISGPVVTAGLSLGEAKSSSGAAALTAMIAGAELGCRIGSVTPGAFHRRGFQATGVIGGFAAGIVAGRLLGLDAAGVRNTLGICGSQAGGLMECFIDGTATKQLHPGWAAHSGIAAAYLAQSGFTGPATVFEGDRGFFHAYADTTEGNYAALTDGLGEDWSCLRTSFKPYPCGHVVHAFLDALLMLYREENLRAEQVERITCPIAAWMIPVMCEPRDAKLTPATEYHAKFSFPFTMAAALTFGRLPVEAFSEAAIRDPDILALAEKIHHIPDPDAPGTDRFKGWVQVDTTDGRRLERIVDDNWGSLANPMTSDQVQQKFRENADLALRTDQIEGIVTMVDRFETLDKVGKLIDLCVRPS
ncbi:MAG: MmgE/PrpD family protein [Alphaproteobacteria bacterium]|nr:MmgE/PrpD family protein [Alphaproteobacteria bacterium]